MERVLVGSRRRGRRALCVLLASALAATAVAFEADPAAAQEERQEEPDWLDSVTPSSSEDDRESPPLEEVESASIAESIPTEPAEASFPEPGSSVVTLGGPADRAVEAADGAVAIAPATEAVDGERVRVEVLEQSVAERAGVSGFVFRVAATGDGAVADLGGRSGMPTELSIDYSAFEHAYGGGYADRLRVVALPACAVAQEGRASCPVEGQVLPARNDAEAKRLTVAIDDMGALASRGSRVGDAAGSASTSSGSASADGAVLLGVTSGPSGETVNYAASPLSPAADWQVAPGSGEFSWSYGVTVPAPPAGAPPAVGLAYSSGAVDGLISTRNTQSPMTGVGFGEFHSSFVERRYGSCEDTFGTPDLCWKTHNASISLNGRSSELIATDLSRNEWRLKDDPGWRVQHLQGADNGDNAGEYWKVTTPDGVQYFFGLGHNPDTGEATDSTWTVPVYADHSGDPCRGAGDTPGVCDQGWRWNLDRVVDPNNMTTTYFYNKALNHYRALQGLTSPQMPYIRGGSLLRIEYGKPGGTGSEVTAAGRVLFEQQFRCTNLNETCQNFAPAGNPSMYPDVPVDLLCNSDCPYTTPTFFVASRSSAVKTEVRVGGAWRPVEQVNLIHQFLQNSDGDKKLYLNGIQRVGLAQQGLMGLPTVNFLYQELPNRVDVDLAAGRKPMGHFRVTWIVDEYRKETVVTYGQPRPCPANKAGPWDTNDQDCFPQRWNGRWAVFHKYLTTRVEDRDGLGGSPTMVSTYAYEGAPAWHHDDDEFTPASVQSWSDWRGYGKTTVTQGASVTKIQVFRGMRNDLTASGGRRGASVTSSDGRTFQDEPWFAGATLEEIQVGGLGETLQSTLHEYSQVATLLPGTDPLDYGVWVGESVTTTSIARAIGVFERQRTTTSYNARFQPETVYEEGWLNQTGDERCTRTTYADNPAREMFTFPSSTVLLAGACNSTNELTRSETYYDGSTTLGAAPSRGNATRQRVRLDASTWATTAEMTYDALGRVATVRDAKEHFTETSYEATLNGGFPRTTFETSHVGSTTHVTRTDWLPEYGVALKVTDPNNNVTSYEYDALGRQTGIRLPSEQPSGSPLSYVFTYIVSPTKAAGPAIRTQQLQSTNPNIYLDSWTVFDSLRRERQRQSLSPTSGQLVVQGTSYDERGLTQDVTSPQAVTSSTPGQRLTGISWENKTRTTYDPLGRVSREAWYRGSTEQWATGTSYTHDTTTVTPPGGRQSRTVIDGLGRTTAVGEWDGTAWPTTTYGYDLADNLTSVTDPAGNTITYGYNAAGWRTAMDDPDAGAWTYGYDPAGNQIRSTDATGTSLHTVYDELSRPRELHRDSPSGPLLASWSYDAAGEKGLLDRTVRVSPQGNWVSDVTGYDSRGRPTGATLTVPAGVPGLSGSYAVSQTYDRGDHVTSVTYPAVGGLSSETVTTTYNSLGLPERMAGLNEYVWSAGYDNRGRPSTFGYGPRPGGATWLARSWSYDLDQRLARMQTAVNSNLAVDHQFTYDQIGITRERTTQLGSQSWRECYGYDLRDRLTSAFTVASTATCPNGTPGTGPQPYNHTYQYSPDGNMRERIEQGDSDVYSYPPVGADRPHAPTAVDGDTYQWNANGSLQTRTVNGDTETFTWDAERRLASVTGADGTNSFLYDADGGRLLRTTPQGRTLYIAGHEITANTSGTSVTAVRSYSFAGGLAATRSPSGVDYLITDQQGSVEAAAASGASSLETSRAYAPYGPRRTGGEVDTDRGWIGQVEDDSTGLAYLNTRYYDPNIATFITPDPLYDAGRLKSQNPYGYAHANPVGNSDPSGAWVPIGGNSRMGVDARWGPRQNYQNIARHEKARDHGRGPSVEARAGAMERRARRSGSWARQDAYAKAYRVGGGRAAQDAVRMVRMRQDNPNPGFWRSLSAAGNPEALVLNGLRAANPDPAFWRLIAGFRDMCGGCSSTEVASRINGSIIWQRGQDQRVAEANSRIVQYPRHSMVDVPEQFYEWVLRDVTGIINDPDVGGGLRTGGRRVRIVVQDVSILPGRFDITVGNETQSYFSMGGSTFTMDFGGCGMCDSADFAVAWSTPLSPAWQGMPMVPTYGAQVWLYEAGWRWPQP